MSWIRWAGRSADRQSLAHERGSTMVEVLIALVLIGLTGVYFLTALTTMSRSASVIDQHSTADSLAISQMEYVLSQSYDTTNDPPQYILLNGLPSGWSVNLTAQRINPQSGLDTGTQQIGVTVSFGGKQVVALTSRKVNIAYVP